MIKDRNTELGERNTILKPWVVIRSGGEMPDNGMMDIILEPYAQVELV